jgi:hypothetical protein
VPTDWDHWFPNCEPVSHHLPLAFPDRWVRFHSLPSSKRYSENEAELATVLERHNRVLGELARPGQTVNLLTTGWSDTSEPVRPEPELSELDPLALPWRTIAMHQGPDNFPEPSYWHVYESSHRWLPGTFDAIVRLIAIDALANVMIVAPDCRWLLHPYDGGMDVIAESSAARDRLKDRFPDWLGPEWLSANAGTL